MYEYIVQGIEIKIATMDIRQKDKIVREYLRVEALQKLLE